MADRQDRGEGTPALQTSLLGLSYALLSEKADARDRYMRERKISHGPASTTVAGPATTRYGRKAAEVDSAKQQKEK